jgi:hypothetical protein
MKIQFKYLPSGLIRAIVFLAGALTFSVSIFAVDAPKADFPPPSNTLCVGNETALFSCVIESKTISLCASLNPESMKIQKLSYRFGLYGKAPELDYSNQERPLEEAFSFSSTSRPFPLETIGFSRGNVGYDVITPDKNEFVRWLYSTGVGVTLPDQPTKLLECKRDSIFINLSPLKDTLGVKPDDGFSEALSKVSVIVSPFPVVKKDIPHGEKWVTKLEYPEIKTPAISAQISKFVTDCYETDEGKDAEGNDEGECVRMVSAKIINKNLMTLNFSSSEYHTGAAHGYGEDHTFLYRKREQNWRLIKSDELFDSSDKCQKLIGSLIYRKLKPMLLSSLEQGTTGPDDLLGDSDVSLDAQGVIFSYQQYELGRYGEGPGSNMIPYKSFGKCFRW